MTKLLGLLGLAAVACVGFAACTVTTSSDTSSSSSDGGSKSDTGSSSDSGSGGDSATGDGGGSCKLTVSISDSKACDTCAEQKCCAVINACAADKDCVDITTKCIDTCYATDSGPPSGDAGSAIDDCINTCKAAYPAAAVKKFDDSQECVNTNCTAQCN